MKRFNQFSESIGSKGVVITWGRFNPPTVGHERVFNTAAHIKNRLNYDLRLYATRTQDSENNPLEYEEKMEYMRKIFPRYKNFFEDSPQSNMITELIRNLREEGYTRIILVVGEDRVEDFKSALTGVTVVSAGHRSERSNDEIETVTASRMRQAAEENDLSTFMDGLPSGTESALARDLFGSVREGLGLSRGERHEVNLLKTPTRENFYQGNLVAVGDRVTTIDGKTGIVEYVGCNYIILKDNNNKKSRHWAKDIESSLVERAAQAIRDGKKRYYSAG